MTRNHKEGPCRKCNRFTELSKRMICAKCALDNQITEQKHLKEKRGEYYEKWKRGIEKYIKES